VRSDFCAVPHHALLAGLAFLAALPVPSAAQIPAPVYVGPTRALTTIQAGINAVSTGGIIVVDAGTYTEADVVNKAVTIGGGPITGATIEVASGGDLGLDATLNGPVTVDSGGILGGAGTVSSVIVNGILQPAFTFNVTNGVTFGAGADLIVTLYGTTAGDYTVLNAGSTINLSNANVGIVTGNGYTPAPGSTYTIIPGATTGTFANLPQGGTVSSGGTTFTAHYGSFILSVPPPQSVPAVSWTVLLLLACLVAAAGLLNTRSWRYRGTR
jgi:hypothetical protein